MSDRRIRMPQGRRTADQAKRDKPRHWVAIQASRHPVSMALIAAVLVAMIPLAMVLDQQNTITRQQDTLSEQQVRLNSLVARMNTDRAIISDAFCKALNANARANNNQTTALENIIVNSTKASKPFENVYRQFGLPPYRERLRQARHLAGLLRHNRVDIADCDAYVRQIERAGRTVLPVAPSHIPVNKK